MVRKSKERGAVLIMVAILIVALIAVAALSLDIGRLIVLRTEMQNAVDAAALAAATELNGQGGAQSRAEHAARTLLQHDGRFAQVRTLLGDDVNNERHITFSFFCAVENNLDPNLPSNITAVCPEGGPVGGNGPDSQKYASNVDANTHYVRVTLNPDVNNQAATQPKSNTIDLYFLPILRAIGINVPTEASTSATAVAGRSFQTCNYPPLMICNPDEPATGDANIPVSLSIGQQVRLYMGATNGTWVPGDFGLLVPPGDKSGATDIGAYLASEGSQCTDPYISTAPGGKVQQVKWGLNTRFGIYGHKYTENANPPAPNVLDFPRDHNLISNPSERIGGGVWNTPVFLPNGVSTTDYWHAYHQAAGVDPTGGLNTRYAYYKWESSTAYPNNLPSLLDHSTLTTCDPVTDDKDCPAGSNIWSGDPGPTSAGIDRRVITVPVLNCIAMNIKGSTPDIWAAKEDYWKRFFLTEHVDDPSGSPIIYAEYLGNVSEGVGGLRVEVKLYE